MLYLLSGTDQFRCSQSLHIDEFSRRKNCFNCSDLLLVEQSCGLRSRLRCPLSPVSPSNSPSHSLSHPEGHKQRTLHTKVKVRSDITCGILSMREYYIVYVKCTNTQVLTVLASSKTDSSMDPVNSCCKIPCRHSSNQQDALYTGMIIDWG